MGHRNVSRPDGYDRADRFLAVAGVAGIVVALGLTIAVLGLTVLPPLLPAGEGLATVVFLALLVAATLATRYVGRTERTE